MTRRLSIGIYPNCLTEILGGSERLCHGLLCYLIQQGHRVVLFCNNVISETPVLPIPKEAELRFVTINNPSNAQIQAVKKQLIAAQLDVFLAFNSSYQQLFWATALLGTGIPYIYSELVEPAYVEKFWSSAGRKAAMSGADRIHMLRAPGRDGIPQHLKERLVVIPSPAPAIPASLSANPQARRIVSLGGQNANKQIPLLINAFEKLYQRFPDWKCEIWGVGATASQSAALAAQSPAKEQLLYKGFADDAIRTLARGSIYCIPSRFEGMPLTLLEAMTLGLPAVGFAQCAGVASLIRHESTGLLAPEMTPESLAAQLARLMSSEELRLRFGQQARQTAEAYAPAHIYAQWDNLLRETAALRGHTQLDTFASEPFDSRARLSAAARREYLLRDFGQPMPGTLAFWRRKIGNLLHSAKERLHKQEPQRQLPPLTRLPPELLSVYEPARRTHANLVRSILHIRREMLPAMDGECGLPSEHMLTGWHHAMLARYFWAATIFPPGSKLCDLGSGLGWGAAILAQSAATVTCVERNPVCGEVCGRFWPELRPHWHTDDILTFLQQTPDASFDGIACMEVLEHLPPAAVLSLVTEAARCLRPGGIILCSSAFPDEDSTFNVADAANPFHEHIYSQTELLALTENLFTERRFLGRTLFMGRKSL